MSNKKAPAATGAEEGNALADSATPRKRKKHPPADQPTPDWARLSRDPLNFSCFRHGDSVKYFCGSSWFKAAVIAVSQRHCIHLQTAVGHVSVYDARNVMNAEQANDYRLHRQRFAALCSRREKKRAEESAPTANPA
jgi:sRNA-binding protein